MKVEGSFLVRAPRAVVWHLLNDPAALAGLIPGCERFAARDDGSFEVILKAGVGAIKGTYTGTVVIEQVQAPDSYVLKIDGKGTAGFIRGSGAVQLTPRGAETDVTVKGDAHVGGLIAGVGQRLLGVAARTLLSEFFRAVDDAAIKQS